MDMSAIVRTPNPCLADCSVDDVEELTQANSMLCMYADMAKADGVCDFLESGALDSGSILQDCQISSYNTDPACRVGTFEDQDITFEELCSSWSAYPMDIYAENCDDLARRNIAAAESALCIFSDYPDFFA
jgi:hypothetical protein